MIDPLAALLRGRHPRGPVISERTGGDRGESRIAVLSANDRAVRAVLRLLLVLNCADAVATMTAIEAGIAIEANPLMKVAYEWGPGWFVAVKFALVSGGVRLLWALRARRAVLPLGATLTALYAAVIGLHAAGVVGAIAAG